MFICIYIYLAIFIRPYQFNLDTTIDYDDYFRFILRGKTSSTHLNNHNDDDVLVVYTNSDKDRINTKDTDATTKTDTTTTTTRTTTTTTIIKKNKDTVANVVNSRTRTEAISLDEITNSLNPQLLFGNFLTNTVRVSLSDNAHGKSSWYNSGTIEKPYENEESLEQKLQYLKTENNEVIVTIATSAFKNLLFNWLCSLAGVGKTNTETTSPLQHLLIYTIDPSFAYELVSRYSISPRHIYVDTVLFNGRKSAANNCAASDNDKKYCTNNNNNNNDDEDSIEKDLKYDTHDYQLLMVHRTRFIRRILKLGYRVLLVDSDSIWFRNPLHYIRSNYRNYDLLAQNDDPNPIIPLRTTICGGFLYLNSTETMKNYWDIVTEKHSYQILNHISIETEQDILNKYRYYLKVKFLPYKLYPSGSAYFGSFGNAQTNFPDVHVVHNNWVIGKSNKLKRFYSFKGFLWLLSNNWEYANTISCKFSKVEK